MSKERIIKAFVKKWWLILIVTLISTGVSFYVINSSKPVYQTTTTLYMISTNNSQKPVITNDSITVGQQLLKDYGEIIKSEKFTSEVIQKSGISDVTNEELSEGVSIDIEKGSNVFRVSYKDVDPEKAQVINSAFTSVLIEKVSEMGSQINLNVVEQAKVPNNPISTNKATNVILSFLISLIAILMVITLLEYIDNTAHTAEDIEKELGFSVIGIIPEMNIK